MQFKVPQFLDIEDKIFGPFTFSQFVYLAGGAGLCFVLFKALGFLFGAIPILLVASFALALTFYRPNGKPFINMIEAGFNYVSQNKLYIWKRRVVKSSGSATKDKEEKGKENKEPAIPTYNGIKLNGSKLRDLAWSLDVLDLTKEEKEN